MPEILKRIIETIKKYEQEKDSEYKLLTSKLNSLTEERKLIIKHLKEGNIELLKTYFNINE